MVLALSNSVAVYRTFASKQETLICDVSSNTHIHGFQIHILKFTFHGLSASECCLYINVCVNFSKFLLEDNVIEHSRRHFKLG